MVLKNKGQAMFDSSATARHKKTDDDDIEIGDTEGHLELSNEDFNLDKLLTDGASLSNSHRSTNQRSSSRLYKGAHRRRTTAVQSAATRRRNQPRDGDDDVRDDVSRTNPSDSWEDDTIMLPPVASSPPLRRRKKSSSGRLSSVATLIVVLVKNLKIPFTLLVGLMFWGPVLLHSLPLSHSGGSLLPSPSLAVFGSGKPMESPDPAEVFHRDGGSQPELITPPPDEQVGASPVLKALKEVNAMKSPETKKPEAEEDVHVPEPKRKGAWAMEEDPEVAAEVAVLRAERDAEKAKLEEERKLAKEQEKEIALQQQELLQQERLIQEEQLARQAELLKQQKAELEAQRQERAQLLEAQRKEKAQLENRAKDLNPPLPQKQEGTVLARPAVAAVTSPTDHEAGEYHRGTRHDLIPPDMKLAFSNVWEPPGNKDVPLFWHIPKNGGTSMGDILTHCLHLVTASNIGVTEGHGNEENLQVRTYQDKGRYVNVNVASPAGIENARKLGLVSSGLADVIITHRLHEAAVLFDNGHKARSFAMFRHPVHRAVSMFHYLSKAKWEPTYDESLASMSLEEYADSGKAEENWVTRFLTNQYSGKLTRQHVDLAKEIMRTKMLVGVLERFGESMKRFELYFGWWANKIKADPDGALNCQFKKFHEYDNKGQHEMPGTQSPGYQKLLQLNWADMEVYQYASQLFDEQAVLVTGKDVPL